MQVTTWDLPSLFKESSLAQKNKIGCLKKFFKEVGGKKDVKIFLARDQATVLTKGKICL